jgi:hypothetical protein
MSICDLCKRRIDKTSITIKGNQLYDKSSCNHIFHDNCIENYYEYTHSPDCPECLKEQKQRQQQQRQRQQQQLQQYKRGAQAQKKKKERTRKTRRRGILGILASLGLFALLSVGNINDRSRLEPPKFKPGPHVLFPKPINYFKARTVWQAYNPNLDIAKYPEKPPFMPLVTSIGSGLLDAVGLFDSVEIEKEIVDGEILKSTLESLDVEKAPNKQVAQKIKDFLTLGKMYKPTKTSFPDAWKLLHEDIDSKINYLTQKWGV